MGYRRYVQPYNDPLYGFKLPIVMLFDQERFRIVGSPLYRVASRSAGYRVVRIDIS